MHRDHKGSNPIFDQRIDRLIDWALTQSINQSMKVTIVVILKVFVIVNNVNLTRLFLLHINTHAS